MSSPPSFAVIPEVDELSTIQRDLRFHPSANPAPQVLSAEQLESFNRDGFLTALAVFNAGEIAAIRQRFDEILAETLAAGGTSYSISTAHLRYGSVYDLLTHPRIMAIVADILTNSVVGWGSHFFCKMPGDGKRVSWHQDSSYWPLTPSKAVTVWLAIDRADRENACMQFLPGSHRYGHLTYTLSENDDDNVLNQTVQDVDLFGQPFFNQLEAGEISIHSDLLLHGSGANRSERRRCGLTLRYCPTDVRAHMGWNEKGVLLRGSDPEGHWRNPPRPEQG